MVSIRDNPAFTPYPTSVDTRPGMAYLGNGHPKDISTATNLTCEYPLLKIPISTQR